MSDYLKEAEGLFDALQEYPGRDRDILFVQGRNLLLLQKALVAAHLNGLREAKAIIDAPGACASQGATTTNKEAC